MVAPGRRPRSIRDRSSIAAAGAPFHRNETTGLYPSFLMATRKRSVHGDAAAQELQPSTRAYSNALPLDATKLASLQRDCATVYTYIDGAMWFPANFKPRCLLESLACAIFERHTHGLDFDRDSAGAEFWAQVRMPTGAASDPIDFHFDVDEHLQDTQRWTRSPHLSTVTYLTDGGAPTVVVHGVRAPEQYRVADVYGAVSAATLSFPRTGKHLVFDGRLLHGAVPVVADDPSSSPRITFLVNIWLDHRPVQIEPMLAALAERLTPPPASRSAAAAAVQVLAGGGTPVAAGMHDAPRVVRVGSNRSGRASACSLLSLFGRSDPPRHVLALLLPPDPTALSRGADGGTVRLEYPSSPDGAGEFGAYVGPSGAAAGGCDEDAGSDDDEGGDDGDESDGHARCLEPGGGRRRVPQQELRRSSRLAKAQKCTTGAGAGAGARTSGI